MAEWYRSRLTSCRSWVRTQPGTLLCVIYFITTALKTVKENIVRKPTCSRTKNSKTVTSTNPHWARVVGYGPLSLREETCVPTRGTFSGSIYRLMMTYYSYRFAIITCSFSCPLRSRVATPQAHVSEIYPFNNKRNITGSFRTSGYRLKVFHC